MEIPEPTNPWLSLPSEAPYVLPDDRFVIEGFNKRVSADKRYDLSLFPEPYFGRSDAPVVLLALNPGCNPRDAATHLHPKFASQSRLSLSHALAPYPFLHLQPNSDSPGGAWWNRITKPLISSAGFDAVAKNISCVQYFPYHSPAFGSHSISVPSQTYSFRLVRDAMLRGAEIVVMLSWRLWVAAIPELSGYRRLHVIRNPRNPTVSPKNMPSGFSAVLARVKAGT